MRTVQQQIDFHRNSFRSHAKLAAQYAKAGLKTATAYQDRKAREHEARMNAIIEEFAEGCYRLTGFPEGPKRRPLTSR
jgi:hypothetical protein